MDQSQAEGKHGLHALTTAAACPPAASSSLMQVQGKLQSASMSDNCYF